MRNLEFKHDTKATEKTYDYKKKEQKKMRMKIEAKKHQVNNMDS